MSDKTGQKRKIVLKRLKGTPHFWHTETGLVFQSSSEKLVIGRVDDKLKILPLDDDGIQLCKDWRFKRIQIGTEKTTILPSGSVGNQRLFVDRIAKTENEAIKSEQNQPMLSLSQREEGNFTTADRLLDKLGDNVDTNLNLIEKQDIEYAIAIALDTATHLENRINTRLDQLDNQAEELLDEYTKIDTSCLATYSNLSRQIESWGGDVNNHPRLQTLKSRLTEVNMSLELWSERAKSLLTTVDKYNRRLDWLVQKVSEYTSHTSHTSNNNVYKKENIELLRETYVTVSRRNDD